MTRLKLTIAAFLVTLVAGFVALGVARADTPPIQQGFLFDLPITGSTTANILTASLAPRDTTSNPSVAFDMTLGVTGADSVAYVVFALADGTKTARALKLNGGTALTADCLYTFSFAVDARETVNFRLATSCTIATAKFEEIQGGGR